MGPRQGWGESQMQLAAAMGDTLYEVPNWETGQTEPTTSQLRALTAHVGVRDGQIDFRPGHPPSITERLADAFEVGR
jgi:hypothetical protein